MIDRRSDAVGSDETFEAGDEDEADGAAEEKGKRTRVLQDGREVGDFEVE